MDTQTLAIIIIVGLVLFIMILKYVLRAAANKGIQAVSNASARSHNEKNGPEIVMLRDLYPDLAARSRSSSGGRQPAPAGASAPLFRDADRPKPPPRPAPAPAPAGAIFRDEDFERKSIPAPKSKLSNIGTLFHDEPEEKSSPAPAPVKHSAPKPPPAPAPYVQPALAPYVQPAPAPYVQPAPVPQKSPEWLCPCCGDVNSGNYCRGCGMKKPDIFS